MINLKTLFYVVSATLLMVSCHGNKIVEETESGFIEITSTQFITDSMVLGKIEQKIFKDIVSCNGIITPLTDGIASIRVPFAGIIKEINCNIGQFVKKGQPLIEISGNELIDLQKELAEAAALFSRARSEYNRIKSLYDDKVGSEKDLKISESDYYSLSAKYNALLLKVKEIGLLPEKIERGEFYPSYLIKAPITGYISSLNAKLGSYMDPSLELLEVTDPEKFQLKLTVFSSDILKLKKGQEIKFKLVNSNKLFKACLNSAGLVLNNNSKSIDCYANISDNSFDCKVNNLFVEADIITDINTVNALPEQAILKSENSNAVLVLDKIEGDIYYFRKVTVNTGRYNNGYFEILGDEIQGKILVKGGFNIVL